MKTSRLFRIFMMALDTVVLILLRPFVRFTRLFTFKSKEGYTDPEKLGIKPELEVDGIATEKYERKDKIWVEPDEKYSEHDGIVTFRSDNLRSGDAYGTADLKEKKLEVVWSVETGKLKKSYGSGWWTGSGWTGQPLIVNWTKEQKEKLIAGLTKTASEILGVDEKFFYVLVKENDLDNWGVGGKTLTQFLAEQKK